MKKGWQGSANSFETPMNKSDDNADNIVMYTWNKLDIHKTDGAWQLAMFNDFSVPALALDTAIGIRISNVEAQKTLTGAFEDIFSDMSPSLNKIDTIVRLVHAEDSEPYKLIWGKNRYRFYEGSYTNRLDALTGLAAEMTTQTVPDGNTAVLAYKADIILKRHNQQVRMNAVDANVILIAGLKKTMIKKLNKIHGGLISNFGDDDNCEAIVNKYFPLNLLGDRSVWGHYQLIIPKGDFRKIGIHAWKEGEKAEIIVGDADVWISTADSADGPITSGYHAVAGTHVIIDPLLLGILTKKYIIATNVNLSTSADVIFNIIKAP